MSFLNAEWRKLAIANYEIDRAILDKHVPYGTELDLWNDKCYVSLVAFMFVNTRLLGFKIPFHINFEEVNLRFYVKRLENNEWKRGVVFIKEIVPKRAISFVANTVYNENYETLKMKHLWEEVNEKRKVQYKWLKNKKWNSIELTANKDSQEITAHSKAEFITEHYWGYSKSNSKKSYEYEVRHPKWREYLILNSKIDVDFQSNYGKEFASLSQKEPDSVMLAEGSEISVENKRKIESP